MSAPPASLDCKLFVISCCWTLNHKLCALVANGFEGETKQTIMNKFNDYFDGLSLRNERCSVVTNMVFLNGVLYCLLDNGKLSCFR